MIAEVYVDLIAAILLTAFISWRFIALPPERRKYIVLPALFIIAISAGVLYAYHVTVPVAYADYNCTHTYYSVSCHPEMHLSGFQESSLGNLSLINESVNSTQNNTSQKNTTITERRGAVNMQDFTNCLNNEINDLAPARSAEAIGLTEAEAYLNSCNNATLEAAAPNSSLTAYDCQAVYTCENASSTMTTTQTGRLFPP